MSLKAMTDALHLPLDPPTKVVLLALADCHNGHTGQCNPRIKLVAEVAQMSERSVHRKLNDLEEAGLIERVERFHDDGRRCSSQYNMLFTYPAKLADGDDDYPDTAVSQQPCQQVAEQEPESEPESPPISPDGDMTPTRSDQNLFGEPDLKTSAATPRGALTRVMGAKDAADVIEHRRHIGKPLSVRAAMGLAKEFAKVDDVSAAVELMIVNGWQGFKAEWYQRAARKEANGNGFERDTRSKSQRAYENTVEWLQGKRERGEII